MNKKINIVFDSTFFINVIKKTSTKSGIFYVAYNIVDILIKNENINLYFYSYHNKEYIPKLKSFIMESFNVKDVKILEDNSKEWINIDIYYSPFYKIPDFILNNNNIKKYTTIHDIIPIVMNNFHALYKSNNENFYKLIQSINKNDNYFSVSNYTKQDFIKYIHNINPNNINTVYLGYKTNLKPSKMNENILTKYNIPKDKKYIFSLCTIEPRKNLIRVIRTFYQFLEKNNINDMVLVLGGANWSNFIGKFNTEIEPYKDKIIRVGFVDDEDLPYLYSNSQWFVYTSQYEGFGLPPLEAMACGCPVITSNNTSLPEVVGDAGIMIDWDSDEQHIEAYEKYYFNENLRKEMGQKGLERSKLFSWEKCANEMLDIMSKNLPKKKNNYIKCEDFIYLRLFGIILTMPRLKTLFSIQENKKFNIIRFFGLKISIKKGAIKNFIYCKKDIGLYRKRTILGINIVTKPLELKLLEDTKLLKNNFNNYVNHLIQETSSLYQNGYANIISLKKNKLKEGKKLKVAFIVIWSAQFTMKTLYEKMLNSEYFDPFIICLKANTNSDYHMEIYNRALKYLNSKYKNVRKSYEYGEYIDHSNDIDIIFYPMLHDYLIHKYYRPTYMYSKNIIMYYSSYGYNVPIDILKENATGKNRGKYFFIMYKVFMDTKASYHEYGQNSILGYRNLLLTGYPKFDNMKNIQRRKLDKTTIILAPHQDVGGYCFCSSFMKYYELYSKLPKLYPNINFVFRPHPLLKETLLKFWNKNQIEEYYKLMDSYENCYLDESDEYYDLFVNSDAIIHDCSSFLIEYLMLNKPVLYMLKYEGQNDKYFNNIGKEALNYCYQALEEKDVINFIDNVILKSNDTMLKNRTRFVEEELKYNHFKVNDFILDDIKKDLDIL